MSYVGDGFTKEILFSSIRPFILHPHPFLKSHPKAGQWSRELPPSPPHLWLSQPLADATSKAMHLECICVHAKSQESFFFFPGTMEVGLQDLTVYVNWRQVMVATCIAEQQKPVFTKGKDRPKCVGRSYQENTQGTSEFWSPSWSLAFCGLLLYHAHTILSRFKLAQAGFILHHKSSLRKRVIKTQHYLDVGKHIL